MVLKSKETAVSAIGSMCADVKTDNAFGGGLGVKVTRVGAGLASHVDGLRYCHNVPTRARISVLARMSKGGLGGLLFNTRRLIATSRLVRGFSFGVNRKGIIAPVLNYGLMLHGKSFDLSLPSRRSANPCGVTHLLGGWWLTSYSQILGIKAMMLTLSRSVSTAFPSIPEPFFKPVVDASKPVSYDVAEDVSVILNRCVKEYQNANREPSLFQRTIRLNVLRAVVEDVVTFCDETLGVARKPTCVVEG